jgi:hypothetical protein
VFELFGFGTKMQATILTNIYPFEKFLRGNKPYIERWQDDVKWHKKNRSLSGFQISLGMGKRLVESGGSTALVYSGSSFARSKLYTWIVKYVVPEKMATSWLVTELDRRSMTNPRTAVTVANLRDKWRTTKGSNKVKHQAGAAIAMTLAYRITRLLYDELLKAHKS